jgi:hypothetical protein
MAYPNYIPQIYPSPMPGTQSYNFQTPQPTYSDPIWVQGIAGAKSYPVAPGHSTPLFDSEDLKVYIKTVDQSGVPQPLRCFRLVEENQNGLLNSQTQEVKDVTITKADLENFRNEVSDMIKEAISKSYQKPNFSKKPNREEQ